MEIKKKLSDYVTEVSKAYGDLGDIDMNLKLNIINFAIQMYNTDNMNKNIGANITITQEETD